MSMNKKRRGLWYKHREYVHDEVLRMVKKANKGLEPERQVPFATALEVANRSLKKNRNPYSAARAFAALRAVSSFITMATTGTEAIGSFEHFDLLPIGHPLSTRPNSMTASALQHAQARWLAADPSVDDSVRSLIAAAHSARVGSDERRYMFARLSALTNDDAPLWLRLDDPMTMFGPLSFIGGNSSAARRARAQLQRRDRRGRFAEMGGGWSLNVLGLDGLFSTVSGRVVGAVGDDAVEVEIIGNSELPDGIYTMPSNKGEAVKAILSLDVVKDLPKRKAVAGDDVFMSVGELQATRKDVPTGWTAAGRTKDGKKLTRYYNSEDGYEVGVTKNEDGTYEYSVRRLENVGESKFEKSYGSWGDVLKAVVADQDEYERDLEKAAEGLPQPAPKPAAPAALPPVAERNFRKGDTPVEFLKKGDLIPRYYPNQLGEKQLKKNRAEDPNFEMQPADEIIGITQSSKKGKLGLRVRDLKTGEERSFEVNAKAVIPDTRIYEPGAPKAEKVPTPSAPEDEETESVLTPFDARDLLERSMRESGGILARMSDDELDRLSNDDGEKLERYNVAIEEAQDLLDGVDPVGSSDNFEIFEQAFDKLGEAVEALEEVDNPDLENAGIELKNGLQSYLDKKDLVDFSGTRATETPSTPPPTSPVPSPAKPYTQAQIEQGESELIDILDSMIGDLEANRNPSQAYETRDWVGYEEAIFPTFVDEQIAEARASGDTELEDFNAPMNAAVDKHRKRLEKIEEMSRKAVERGDIKSAEGLAEELKRLRDDIAAEGPEDEEENAARDLERSSFLESVSERARLALDGNEFDEILESALDSNALTPEEKINIDDAVALFDREIDEANGLVDDDDRDEALNDAGNAFYDRVSEIIEGKRAPATPMTPPPSRPPTGVERAESGDSVKSMMKDLLELENGEAPNWYKAIYTNLIEEDGQIIDGATLEMPDGSKVVYDRDAREWVYSDADGVELNRIDALDPKASEKIFKGFEDRVPKKPAKPAVDSGLPEFLETEFDEMFEAPFGSHKPNIFEVYSPVGRQGQDSEDYTDDPSILSNKFSTEELGRALREAVLPSAVGNASGQGTLEFEAGDELVPAEALYEALQMSGLDADMLLAAFYDSMLPDDPSAPTNVDRVQERRSEVPSAPSEPEIVPLTDRGKAVEEAIKLNEALGIPARAQRGVELMNEYNEGNDKLLGIAEKLNSLQDFDDAYDDEGLTNLLKDYIPFANSGDPDEVEAFAGLWGLLMSLDGGASNDQPGPEELADGGFRARVRRAIEESLREGDNDDIDIEDLVDDIYNDIVETYGGFPEFVAGREAISNGEGDLSDRTTAAAFYRLTKAAARPTTVEVQRSIGVDPSDPLFTRYTTPGSVFSIDPRSFTTNNLADAKGLEGLQFAPGSNFAHVIFRVAPGDADTFSAKTISWFPGEEEHLGWGNYEVVGVRTLDNPLRPNQPKVEVMIRKTDSEVGVPSEQSIFEDTNVDVSNWRKTGSQAGSNPGGFYEDDDGNEYYVKIPKSQKHAENEVLASKFYERLGVPAAEVRLGEDNGETRIVSPLIPGAVGDLSEHLDDEEYLRKLRDGFVADAWLANWDVAGLVFDNVMSDADGNPVRVDPGGSLIYRARGSEKGAAFGDKVGEIDTLRDPDLNPQNAQIFGGITDEELMDQASRLRRLPPEEIDAIIDSVVTDPEMASKLKVTLKARREDILSRFPGDDDDDIFTERTPLTDALSREVSSLEPGDILGEDSFVIESVFTDDRTPDGKISVQGYYPGHQSQRKEYDPTAAVEASRGGAIPPKGDNEPLHRPEPPTNPDNPAEMAAYRDELAQYEMAKAVASAWNCGGAGLTAAVGGNGPCSVPSVDQLIDKVNSDTVGPIEVPDQDGVDVTQANTTAKAMKAYTENIDEAFESIDLLEKDEDVKPSVKKKLATVKSKLQEIRDNVGNFGGEDQKISNEEAISQLNELISGLDRTNDDIDFIASAIERLRDVVDGSAFLEKADPNLPPPGMMHPKKGFPLGYAKDGVTKVVPGMLVRDKDGFAGVVDRYEKANWVGVYVINALDGQLYMKATHQLVPINPGDDDSAYIEKPGGYSGHPKMKTLVPQGSVDTKFDGWNEKAKKKNEDAFGPRQESAEVPKVEAPSGAPKVSETSIDFSQVEDAYKSAKFNQNSSDIDTEGLIDYITYGTEDINGFLRAEKEGYLEEWEPDAYDEEAIADFVKTIDKIIDSAPTFDKPITVYRGTVAKKDRVPSTGDTISSPGYMSTSLSQEVAEDFTRFDRHFSPYDIDSGATKDVVPVIYEIEVPPGEKFLSVPHFLPGIDKKLAEDGEYADKDWKVEGSDGQQEMLLARGATIEVLETQDRGKDGVLVKARLVSKAKVPFEAPEAPAAPAAPAAPEIAETPEPLPSDVGDDASALQFLSAGTASNMLQEGVSSALAIIEDIDTDKLDDQEQGQLSDVYSYLSNASMILSNIIPDGSDLNYEMFQEALQEMTYAQDTLSDLESNNPMFGEASRELMIRTEDYLKYEDLGKIDWNGSSLEQPDEDEEEINAEIEADAVSEEVDIDVPEYISSGEGEQALRTIVSIVQENLEKVDTSNLAETDKTSLDDAKSKLESVVEKFDKGQKGSYETYMLALNDARVARDILSQTSGDKAFPTAVEDIDSLIRYAETKVDIVSDEEVTMKDLAEFITPAVMRDQLKFALQDALAVVDEFDESYPDYFKNEKKIDKTLKHIKAALASLASVDTAGSAENKKLFKSARSEMEKASNLLDQLEEFSYDAAEVKGNIDVALEEFDQADSEDRIDYKGTIMKAAKQAFGEEVAVDQIITSGKMRDDLVAEITDVTTTIDKLDLEDMYLEDFAEDIVAAYKILKSTLADLSSIDPDGAEKNSGLFAAVTSDMERAKDLLEEANGNFEVKKAIDKIDLALMAYEDVTNGGLLDFNGDKLAKAKKEADIVDEEQEVTPEVPLSNAPLTDSDRVKYEELFLSETTKLAAVTSLLNLSDSSKLGQDDLTRKYSAKQSIEDARNILRKMPSAYDRESKDKLLDDTERVLLDARAQLGSSGDYYLLQAASEISLYLDYVHGRRELIGIDYATPVTKNEEFAAAEARESLIGILDEAIKGVVLSKSNEGYAELYEDLLDARQAAGKLKNRDGFDAEAYKSIREVIGSRMSGISDLLGEDEENEKRLEKIRKNIERFDKIPAYIRGSKQPLAPSTQEPLLEQAPNKYEDFKKMPAGLRGSISMVMDELKTMQAMFELEYSSDMLQVKQGFMNPKDLTNKLIADLREGKVRFSEIATRVEEIRERHEEIARTGQNASITQTSISSSTSYGSVAGVLSSLRDARDNVYEQISLHPDIANDRYKLDIGEVPTDPYADEPYFSNEKVKNYSGIKELANVFGYREKNPDKTVDTFEAMRQMKTTDWVSTFAKHLYARIQIDAGRMEDDENVASVEEIIQTANDIKRMLDHAGFGSTMYGPIREGLLMFFGAQKLSPTLRSTVNDIIEKKLDAALGVERPKDVERLPWDRSGLRGIPSLEDATDMSRKRRGQIISTAVDGADIEDLTVEVTTALPSTTSKKLQTRYTFKLTSWAARKFDEKFDLGDKPGFTTTRDIVLSVLKGEGDAPRTFGKKTLSADSVGSGRTMTYEFDDKIDGVPVKIRLIRADREGNTAGKAFNSQVTILVPDGTDPQIVQKAMEKVGVVEARPAMPIDTRALIENRMISVFMGQTDANDNVNNPDRRAQYLRTIKERFGLTPDDVKLVPASAGRIEMRIPPEVAAKIKQETGVLNFYHSLYTMSDKRVSSILSWTEQKRKAAEIIADMFTSDVGTEGTLLATTKRFLRGMKSVTGMSQSEDIRTGGADYIFTTPSDSDFYIQNGGQLKFVYDSEKMFERIDFYSNEWDAYGARESSSDVIGMTRDGSHETIFKGGIGPEALRHLIVPDKTFKEFIIEEFRKRGINSINGTPIEVFVTYGTAKEAKDLALVQPGETDNDGNPVADDF